MIRILLLLTLLMPRLFACALCSLYTPSADVTVDFDVQNDTIRSAVIGWSFTEKFTDEILTSYDQNDNRQLDADEMEGVKEALIKYIRPVHYLTTLKFFNETDQETAQPLPFQVESWEFRMLDNKPFFTYTIPINKPIEHGSILSLQFQDDGGYFDFIIRSTKLKPSEKWHVEPNVNASVAFFTLYERERYITKQITAKEPAAPVQTPNGTSPAKAEETNPFLAFLAKNLKALSDAINGYINTINKTGSILSYFWLLFFSLLYGILHAAGPGHGKSLVSSYFLAHDHDYAKAYSIAFMIAVVHTFSAFVSTLIIYFILNMFFAQFFSDLTFYTTKISALLIIVVALYLLYKKVPKKPESGSRWSTHPPTCSCGSCKLDTGTTDLGVIVSAGIIPCPGTVTIFILTLSLGEYFVGFLSAVFMSIGMSLVILLAATLSIGIRNRISGRFSGLTRYLDYISLGIILSLGIALFFVNLS